MPKPIGTNPSNTDWLAQQAVVATLEMKAAPAGAAKQASPANKACTPLRPGLPPTCATLR